MENDTPIHRGNLITLPFVVAWILFALSMFLPVEGVVKGWECAWISILAIAEWSRHPGWSLYYFLFTIPNVAMLFSPLALIYIPSRRKWLLATTIFAWCCATYVISFAVLVPTSPGGKFGIAYYLWAASFVIFAGEWLRQAMRLNLVSAERPRVHRW